MVGPAPSWFGQPAENRPPSTMHGSAPEDSFDDIRDRRGSWAARNPDVIVIAVWLILAAVAGFSRRDFGGDGLRHLGPIVSLDHPKLGEPRWLLFPSLMFILLRPFVALGLVTSVEGLARPMMAAVI